MLQQILKDLYIDPELLAELDDEQKRILFFKMRQEQIRLWKDREEKLIGQKIDHNKNVSNGRITKTVDFLLGEDKNPWTWVMGEHPDDIPLDRIFCKYSQDDENSQVLDGLEGTKKEIASAPDRQQPETFTHQSGTTPDLQSGTTPDHKQLDKTESSPDRLITLSESTNEPTSYRRISEPLASSFVSPSATPSTTPVDTLSNLSVSAPNVAAAASPAPLKSIPQSTTNSSPIRTSTTSTVYPKLAPKISAPLKLTVEKIVPEVFDDILRSNQNKGQGRGGFGKKHTVCARRPSVEDIKADGREIFKHWMEQEAKARKIDEERRLVAKQIREDNARLNRKLRTESQIIGTLAPTTKTFFEIDIDCEPSARQAKPLNMASVVKWYLEEEKPKGTLFDSKTEQYANYFHGTIDRKTAEDRLVDGAEGTFLIRLSDKIWGYALSYKGTQKIRHYLVDAMHHGGYQFFGYNHPPYLSLEKFIENYKTKQLSVLLPEKLVTPCVRTEELTFN